LLRGPKRKDFSHLCNYYILYPSSSNILLGIFFKPMKRQFNVEKCQNIIILHDVVHLRNGDFVAKKNKKKQSINDIKADKQKEPIKDFSQTKDIVKVLSGEIGPLVEQFLGAIYNVDVAETFADALIRIYNKLREEGITKQTAEKIMIEYSANVDRFAAVLKKKD